MRRLVFLLRGVAPRAAIGELPEVESPLGVDEIGAELSGRQFHGRIETPICLRPDRVDDRFAMGIHGSSLGLRGSACGSCDAGRYASGKWQATD